MNSVLVLHAGEEGLPDWLRRALPAQPLRNAGRPERCASIVVVNDHSAESVRLLEKALSLRRKGQVVLVVTVLADTDRDLDALVDGVAQLGPERRLDDAQIAALLGLSRLPARTHLGEEGVSFEYTV